MSKTIKQRCGWVPENDALYQVYHDEEWGMPVYDDQRIFEFLVLESAQAGLSWIMILRKRENYREAFAGFDPEKVAQFTARDVTRLLNNSGIIRNRRKIESTITNALCFLDVQKEFDSFSKYIWGFVGEKPIKNQWKLLKDLPVTTDMAVALSKDLRKRGFKFLGPTVVYAHMQATGMVNDHTIDCFRHKEVGKKAPI